MSLFKRDGSPFWQCEFIIRGHRVSRSTRKRSRRDAEKFEADLKEQTRRDLERQSTVVPLTRLTIDAACGRYWIEHGSRLSDHRNVKRYLQYICRHIDQEMWLSALSTKHIAEFILAMREAGIGERAINHTVVCLQGVHNRAAKIWEEPVRVIDWTPHKSAEKQRTNWITQDQARELIAELHPETAEIVHFILLVGARKTEAFDLERSKIDWDQATATVIQKGGREHVFELSPEAMQLLRSLPDRGQYVFDTTGWRKRFDYAKRAVGLDDLRWHDLRHTHATWLGQSGASLEVIKQQLGHSSINVTQKYRHVNRTEVRKAMQKVPTLVPTEDNIVPLKRRK